MTQKSTSSAIAAWSAQQQSETSKPVAIITCTYSKLDITNQQMVNTFFETERPEYVFLAAARVGGILTNSTHIRTRKHHT